MEEKKNPNKKIYIIIGILILIILFLILYLVKDKKFDKVFSQNSIEKSDSIAFREENKQFFENYLYAFQDVFGRGIGGSGNLSFNNEDYSKFVAIYYARKIKDENLNTFTISKEKVDKLLEKYFGVTNYKLESSKDYFTIEDVGNDYKITIIPMDYGYDIYKIDSVKYDNTTVTVKYNIYQGNIIEEPLRGYKIITLKYENSNYHVKRIEVNFTKEIISSTNSTNDNKTIKHESKDFFQKYLEPFQFCNARKMVNQDSYETDYPLFTAMYYIELQKGNNNNTNKLSIPKKDVKELLYKYFGSNDTEFDEDTMDYTIKRNNDNFDITWVSKGCGSTTFSMHAVSYYGNVVVVEFDEMGLDSNMLPTNVGRKTFILEYSDNNYRVRKIIYNKF